MSFAQMRKLLPTVLILVVIALAASLVVRTYKTFAHTLDEPVHIAAGMELLDRGRFTYEQQHPPLARLAAALGPYLEGARSQGNPDMLNEGLAILYGSENYQGTLTAARLGILPFVI